MKLIQELMATKVNEATNQYASSFHPKDVAKSVKEFRKFLDHLGYTSEDGDYIDVKYLGFSKNKDYVFLMLARDSNEDEFMISKFFCSFNENAELTGDFAGNVMHTFSSDEEDEAQDKFDSIDTL